MSNLEKSPIKKKKERKKEEKKKGGEKLRYQCFFKKKMKKLAEYSSAIIAKNVFVALQDVYRIHLSIPK